MDNNSPIREKIKQLAPIYKVLKVDGSVFLNKGIREKNGRKILAGIIYDDIQRIDVLKYLDEAIAKHGMIKAFRKTIAFYKKHFERNNKNAKLQRYIKATIANSERERVSNQSMDNS